MSLATKCILLNTYFNSLADILPLYINETKFKNKNKSKEIINKKQQQQHSGQRYFNYKHEMIENISHFIYCIFTRINSSNKATE